MPLSHSIYEFSCYNILTIFIITNIYQLHVCGKLNDLDSNLYNSLNNTWSTLRTVKVLPHETQGPQNTKTRVLQLTGGSKLSQKWLLLIYSCSIGHKVHFSVVTIRIQSIESRHSPTMVFSEFSRNDNLEGIVWYTCIYTWRGEENNLLLQDTQCESDCIHEWSLHRQQW